MSNLVLIIGDVINGHQIIGPFTDHEEIDDYVQSNRIRDWIAAELISPERTPKFKWKSGSDILEQLEERSDDL